MNVVALADVGADAGGSVVAQCAASSRYLPASAEALVVLLCWATRSFPVESCSGCRGCEIWVVGCSTAFELGLAHDAA
jgi:hypothetical protein